MLLQVFYDIKEEKQKNHAKPWPNLSMIRNRHEGRCGSKGVRKKDFWNLHELLENYSIGDMIAFHCQRYEWTHDETLIRQNFTNFCDADIEPDPICLRGKHWEFIKEDIEDALDANNLR